MHVAILLMQFYNIFNWRHCNFTGNSDTFFTNMHHQMWYIVCFFKSGAMTFVERHYSNGLKHAAREGVLCGLRCFLIYFKYLTFTLFSNFSLFKMCSKVLGQLVNKFLLNEGRDS